MEKRGEREKEGRGKGEWKTLTGGISLFLTLPVTASDSKNFNWGNFLVLNIACHGE